MHNIVFCFEDQINKHIDDAFDFTSRTEVVKKEASLIYYRYFLHEVLKANQKYVPVKLLVQSQGEYLVLELNKINYVEIYGRVVAIHSDEGIIESYAVLEEMEERLRDLGFFRVHRSFLVAINKIKKVSRTWLTLNTEEEIPIGKTYYKKVREKMEECYLKI